MYKKVYQDFSISVVLNESQKEDINRKFNLHDLTYNIGADIVQRFFQQNRVVQINKQGIMDKINELIQTPMYSYLKGDDYDFYIMYGAIEELERDLQNANLNYPFNSKKFNASYRSIIFDYRQIPEFNNIPSMSALSLPVLNLPGIGEVKLLVNSNYQDEYSLLQNPYSRIMSLELVKNSLDGYGIIFHIESSVRVDTIYDLPDGIGLYMTDKDIHNITLSNGEVYTVPNYILATYYEIMKYKDAINNTSTPKQKHINQFSKYMNNYDQQRFAWFNLMASELIKKYKFIIMENQSPNPVFLPNSDHVIPGWVQFQATINNMIKSLGSGNYLINTCKSPEVLNICHNCEHKVSLISEDIPTWICPKCGYEHDAKVNAARNVLKNGITVIQGLIENSEK